MNIQYSLRGLLLGIAVLGMAITWLGTDDDALVGAMSLTILTVAALRCVDVGCPASVAWSHAAACIGAWLAGAMAWGASFRLAAWLLLQLGMAAAMLLVLGASFAAALGLMVALAPRWRQRQTWVVLMYGGVVGLAALAFLVCGVRAASIAGRTALRNSIGLDVLTAECRQLLSQSRVLPGQTEDVEDDLLPPGIRRLRPGTVVVQPGRVRIALHGGFDHFGYEYFEESTNEFVLVWYTEGGRTIIHRTPDPAH
jgi:hypothetical protein